MRTEQERMELIRKRILEIRKKEKKCRLWIADIGCAAVSAFLVVCIGVLMPRIAGQSVNTKMDGLLQGAASIFENNSAQGYILMGIICFSLGACATIWLYRIHRKTEDGLPEEF